MNRKIDQVDEFGFPIPPGFESLQPQARQSSPRLIGAFRYLLVFVAVALLLGLIFKEGGRQYMATMYSNRAEEKFLSGNADGAISDLNMALLWMPDSPELHLQRAQYRMETQDLQGSLDDFNRLVMLAPTADRAYSGRSVVYQRLEQHRRAIDDVSKAISLRPGFDHTLLNHRAYTRAIANMELDEALEDIQRAIDMAGGAMPEYLDTRGYIYHLLGRNEEALVDLDRAIELIEDQRHNRLRRAVRMRFGANRVAWLKRRMDENEGVITYHRGLVHEKLGHSELAHADKSRGVELGYDPAKGVY